jgi:hypothetical protein
VPPRGVLMNDRVRCLAGEVRREGVFEHTIGEGGAVPALNTVRDGASARNHSPGRSRRGR